MNGSHGFGAGRGEASMEFRTKAGSQGLPLVFISSLTDLIDFLVGGVGREASMQLGPKAVSSFFNKFLFGSYQISWIGGGRGPNAIWSQGWFSYVFIKLLFGF